MRKGFQIEFIYSLFSLLITFIIVHAIYVAVIRPNAEVFLAEEIASTKSGSELCPSALLLRCCSRL
jgi:hypothetical protein